MEVAARGLARAGAALADAVDLARTVLPQAYDLAERGVDQVQRIADQLERANDRREGVSEGTDTIDSKESARRTGEGADA